MTQIGGGCEPSELTQALKVYAKQLTSVHVGWLMLSDLSYLNITSDSNNDKYVTANTTDGQAYSLTPGLTQGNAETKMNALAALLGTLDTNGL